MTSRHCLITAAALLLCRSTVLAIEDSIFDVKALTSTPLNSKILSSSEKDGIVTQEVMFHSEMDGEKSVDIFAFFSYPKSGVRLPAFIWNQGGLGRADASWTELGAQRGYATLCIDFPLPGYRSTGGYPITSHGLYLAADPRQCPIYHGAVALLKAVSYLQSRPEVDRDRIGMSGSSWGGFYTTLMVGVDPRLKAGSAMFGTGNLQLGNWCWDGRGWDSGRNAEFRERWRTTLDPGWRLGYSKTPIAWFTGTNDGAFWMPSVMESYRAAVGPKNISLLPNYNHALTPKLDEQVFQWLDTWLKGGPAFERVTPIRLAAKGNRPVTKWTFSGPRKVVSADLAVSYGEPGNWSSRYWLVLPARIHGNECSVELPSSSYRCCVTGSVVDAHGRRYSTPLLWLGPVGRGVGQPDVIPDYDGCSNWGDFEESQVSYLRLQAIQVPPLSREAKSGRQSAILGPGKTNLPPVLFTAGIRHQFTCYLKADQAASVAVELVGIFDGEAVTKRREFSVGTGWTKVAMDYTPPGALTGGMSAVITVPEGTKALADSVSFHPARHESGARQS